MRVLYKLYFSILTILFVFGDSLGVAADSAQDAVPHHVEATLVTAHALIGNGVTTADKRLLLGLFHQAEDVDAIGRLIKNLPRGGQQSYDMEMFQLLAASSAQTDDLSQIRALRKKTASPMLVVLLTDLMEQRSKGSLTVHMYMDALTIEPFWIPALRLALSHNGGSWLAASVYGSIGLDLLNEGTREALKMMQLFPGAEKTVRRDTKEYADAILKDFNAYISATDGVWKRNHPHEQAWMEAALLLHAGEIRQATVAYERIVSGEARRPSAYYRLARLYESQNRREEAEATIQAGLANFPVKNSILLVIAAEYAMKKGNLENALNLLSRCLINSPEYPPAHILRAEIEIKQGNRDAAIKACGDTAVYSYRWDEGFLERINTVLKTLLQLKDNK